MQEQEEKWHFRGMVIPGHMRKNIEFYIKLGQPADDFLKAIICNDLKKTVMLADDYNIRIIPAYVNYFYNSAPLTCWGNEKTYERWLKAKR